MHSYLRAIGFSEYNTKEKVIELFNLAVQSPDKQTALVSNAPETYVELSKEFAEDMGIVWHGTILEGEPDFDYYFPYHEGVHTFLRKGFSAEKRLSNNSFSGVIEDLRAGVSVIFYLINALDYMEWNENKQINYNKTPIALSGLSLEGTILLPVNMSESEMQKRKKESSQRTKLMTAARNGDEDAIESLTFEDMDIYTKISKRIMSEDVFSIVTCSFMPYGLECDKYTIVADILEVSQTKNTVTDETIWKLLLDYNGILIDLAINALDLLGEPEVGRRFKGTMWLQGGLNR